MSNSEVQNLILDTTHSNKEHKKLIRDLIGRPYSFWESLKMGGVGSKRMIIEQVSPNMNKYLNKISDINYANIEMRSDGILIYINKGLKNYTWVIPYYQLVIYKSDGTSIHSQGKFIRFKKNRTFKENAAFIKKLFSAKVNYDKRFEFQGL
ncbi:hypothetical protein AB9K26_08030 [Psychroserpens sp. XS_ASV72]|uniref:hypothetical protein n=1 Tax=Psychroserpens sp. XS_ASV72 TaxID=3241293 RepID=UPI0035163933